MYLQAGRSIESIFAELASNGLVRDCPRAMVADYLGGPNLGQEAAAEPQKARKGKTGGWPQAGVEGHVDRTCCTCSAS